MMYVLDDRFPAEAISMNLLAAIKREERKLEKQLGSLRHQLDGMRSAAQALARSASEELGSTKKRALSAAARKKISKAAKRRWAKVKAGAKKAVS
jgi:t-SNARE complex subunit (syntaxin)